MKLPDPFFGLCYLRTGAMAVAFIHCLTAFHVMVKFIERVVPIELIEESNLSGLNIFILVLIMFGLVGNFILQVILICGIMKENLAACRTWLVLGPIGAAIWIAMAYYMSRCFSCTVNPLTTSCIILNVVGIIYTSYVFYVITAYTMSLWDRRDLGGRGPAQRHVIVRAESGPTMDKNNNPVPGKLISQTKIQSLIQAPPGIQLKQ